MQILVVLVQTVLARANVVMQKRIEKMLNAIAHHKKPQEKLVSGGGFSLFLLAHMS